MISLLIFIVIFIALCFGARALGKYDGGWPK
jgi:hypothetical protein